MTLLTRIAKEKRLLISLVALVLVAAVALHTLGVYPQTRGLRDARQRQADAAQSLEAAQLQHESAQSMMRNKNGVTAELEAFHREVLPADLGGARDIAFPSLSALARVHGLTIERRTSVSERVESGHLARLRASLLLAGDWSNIREFIHSLENGPDFVVIEHIVLGQGEEGDDSLVLDLGLATYYRPPDGT